MCLALAAPSAARAGLYPGERPITDPLVRQAADVGVRFWEARGVHPCPNPVLLSATSLLDDRDGVDAAARADVAGCRIWIRREIVRDAVRERPFRPGRGGDSAREALCATVAHELGHLAGLVHTATGLMSEDGGSVIPYECRVWRRRLDSRTQAVHWTLNHADHRARDRQQASVISSSTS